MDAENEFKGVVFFFGLFETFIRTYNKNALADPEAEIVAHWNEGTNDTLTFIVLVSFFKFCPHQPGVTDTKFDVFQVNVLSYVI